MRKHIEGSGFASHSDRALGNERGTVAVAQLVASIGLALCTIIAATVVSAGIARASVAINVIDNEGGFFLLALVLGLLFIGMGGFTIMNLPHDRKHRH